MEKKFDKSFMTKMSLIFLIFEAKIFLNFFQLSSQTIVHSYILNIFIL